MFNSLFGFQGNDAQAAAYDLMVLNEIEKEDEDEDEKENENVSGKRYSQK